MPPRSNSLRAIDILEKVNFLSSPDAYSHHPGRVDVIETHMSWVFLADDFVFKLKKPVRYPFLDFSTVAAREMDCRTEVRLNERLAPGIYIGVVALTHESDAKLTLNGTGTVVDWLVKMRRIPAEQMLDQAIAHNTVKRAEIEKVADVLADFYRSTRPAELTAQEYVAQFARQQAQTQSVLTRQRFDLPPEKLHRALKLTGDFIALDSDLLAERQRDGHIVEGHGDLRPEHICLVDPPVIIDCLEFNRSLRLVDPFDELAFLGMECTRLGVNWIGNLVMSRCRRALDDRPANRLIAFYTAFRALLRARLALSHLLEPKPRQPHRWAPLAKQYVDIAERASLRIFPPEAPRATRRRGSVE